MSDWVGADAAGSRPPRRTCWSVPSLPAFAPVVPLRAQGLVSSDQPARQPPAHTGCFRRDGHPAQALEARRPAPATQSRSALVEPICIPGSRTPIELADKTSVKQKQTQTILSPILIVVVSTALIEQTNNNRNTCNYQSMLARAPSWRGGQEYLA